MDYHCTEFGVGISRRQSDKDTEGPESPTHAPIIIAVGTKLRRNEKLIFALDDLQHRPLTF